MTDLTVRETAARAIYETEPLPGVPTWDRLASESDEWPDGLARVETKRRYEQADAVLAAVAAHDGLADVLRDHAGYGESCDCGAVRAPSPGAPWPGWHAAHQADVVRAWLGGET